MTQIPFRLSIQRPIACGNADAGGCWREGAPDIVLMLLNHRLESWPAVVHANGAAKPRLEEEGRAAGGRRRTWYGEMVP